MGKVKLNPELMIGDEIMVVSTEGIHDFGVPELYKPYLVVGIKYNHNPSDPNRRDNRPDYDKPFYQIEPLDMTDEQRTGAMLAGGGRMRPMYIFLPEDGHGGSDQWILRPGFLRGELNEQTEPNLNPTLEVDDEILLVDIKKYGLADPPKLYTPYKVTRIQYPNQYQPSNAPIFYMVYPVDETQEEEEKRREEREREWDKGEHVVGDHNGDTWIFNPGFKRGEHLTEHKEEPGLSPELTYGDTILVVDVDREVESNTMKYNIPSPEMKPEIYTPYTVVDKEANGNQSRWPWRYTLVPEDKLEEYEDMEDMEDEDYLGYEKLLYPWIYQWIHADTPTASGVDRLTISEHNQSGLSPDLDKGDIIRVIEIDGEHANMPDIWGVYKVHGISQDNATQELYYELSGETSEVVPDTTFSSTRLTNAKYLYHGDIWIPEDAPMATKVGGKTISEHKEEVNQRLTMGDIIRVVDVDKVSTYEQPTYDYDTGNASGNSLRTNHRREQVHGEDTYPRPMKLYMVMSKSTYRPKDRDYLNPYWMIWPVDKDGKIEDRKDLHQPILTEKDTWMTVKKHHSNITGDIEAKQKEYDDSGRNIISRILDVRRLDEQEVDDFSDEEKREIDNEHVDMTPFKPMEVKILKTLHKYLTRSDLQSLSQETPPEYGELGKKFWDLMKMFGITPVNTEQDTRTSKYAKWALDNWTEEGDYGNIEDPIKVPLKWYQVDREESGSQVEYKDGTTEVLGFDEDDAGQRGDYNFWDWGGEMETNDYGDYETYDSEIVGTEFLRMDEGLGRVLRENTRVSDNFDDPLFLSMDKQKIQDLLFNYWRKFGPTLDDDKLKLLGFDMKSYDERGVVWDNLQEYYGDEELTNIIQDRLEGLHDSWNYEYIVTDWSMDSTGDIDVNVLVNGDAMMPISQESGEVIDMSLWDINKSSAEDDYQYDDAYEEVRSTISDDISNVLLKDLPVDMNLDYLDMSEPGTFEVYVKENEVEMITEDDDGYIDDMVYIDEPREKHIRRMGKDLGDLTGFPIEEFKNLEPPKNESDTTEEEIEQLKSIPVDNDFIESAEKVGKHFQKFLEPNGLEYPKEEIKSFLTGVKAIVLQLKYHYNRPRPWQISDVRGLCLDCDYGDLTSTPSYPSGHATEGRFVARYLSELYPEYANELREIGDDIAYSRNMAKVHYPSDSAFGKLLGDALYEYVSHTQLEPDMVYEHKDAEIIIKDKSHKYDNKDYEDFIDYALEELNIEEPFTLYIEKEPTGDYTGGTYRYKGGSERIKVRSKGRSLMDILRSIAHELVHHKQKEDGKFEGKEAVTDIPIVGGPIEDEANAIAGRLIKKYGQENKHLYESTIDMLKSDIFKVLSNRFILNQTDYSELKDDKGNYYRIIDMENPYEPVTLSDLIEPAIEFMSYGIKSGDFEEEDMNTALTAITNWVSLEMNQKEELVN